MSKILIVEDEMIISMEIRETLERLGYEVSGQVISGEEAIKKTEETTPDLILMDIRLQGKIDGIEAARVIKRRYDIPIIFLTAHSDRTTLERAISISPSGYLIKPFKDRELYSNIEMNLRKQQIRRSIRPDLKSGILPDNSLDTIDKPCIGMDLNGMIVRVNDKVLNLLGKDLHDLLWTRIEDLIGDFHAVVMVFPVHVMIKHVSGTLIPVTIDLGYVNKNGVIQELLIFINPDN